MYFMSAIHMCSYKTLKEYTQILIVSGGLLGDFFLSFYLFFYFLNFAESNYVILWNLVAGKKGLVASLL